MSALAQRLGRAEAALSEQYAGLTPEQRFQLILAAGVRGDEAEQGRLANAGQRITLTMPDHAPFSLAFLELSQSMFLEVLDTATEYTDTLQQLANAAAIGTGEAEGARTDGEGEDAELASDLGVNTGAAGPGADDWPITERWSDLAMLLGYTLKNKCEAWRLFCQRLNVPPFATWQHLPGYDRVERAWALAENVAFVPEGMLRWLNHMRPEGEPEVTNEPFDAKEGAAALDRSFRERVRWWGGQ
jgi:hypothetical protein